MKILSNLLLLVFTASIFMGCNKADSSSQEQAPIEEVLTGTWNLSKDRSRSKTDFISFEKDTLRYRLNSKDTIKAKWSFNANDSSLVITPIVPLNSKLDSTIILVDESGERKVHYVNGKAIAQEKNGELKVLLGASEFSVYYIKKRLLLKNKEDNFLFTQPTKVKNNSNMQFHFSSVLRGIGGIAFLILIAFIFSANRRKVNWSLVGKGILLQIIIALLVLKVPAVELAFDWVSGKFVQLISYTDVGIDFLFGQLGVGEVQAPLLTFAIKVLPTIIFFSALVSLFYYWGILQKIVYAFAWVMKKFMKLSGAESLAAAGNVFLGQTEAPLLVKPYLLGMTKSEIMCLMTGGMATIAGGVLAAYVNFLGGDDPVEQAFFAKHLLTASIISAPAAIIAAKILVPETEKFNENLQVNKEKIGTNALEAITNGTSDGLRLAVNVGAMLLVFIALMALANGVLGWFGGITGANEVIAAQGVYDSLSFEYILGHIGRPIVWIMGVEWADSLYVGELLGTKTVLNEFVAYPRLGELKQSGMLSEKSVIMSTYMLCGFANFASIGIQIGGIGALIPNRKGLLSKLGVQSLIGGTIACLMTAVIVGMTM